jgi:hypothetical protein
VPLDRLSVLFPKNRHSSTGKKELFSQEMHSKIPLFSRGLELSNSKPCCQSQLFSSSFLNHQLFYDIRIIQLSGFQLLIAGLTSLSLWKAN